MTSLPPGPQSSVRTLLRYFRDPIECMRPLAQQYGADFSFPGKPPLVCLGDPISIKALYAADPDSLEPANTEMGVFIGERSLLLLKGAEHRRARKLMMPPFHGARMRAYGQRIIDLTLAHVAGWRAGTKVPLLEVAQRISLDVILQAVFGLEDRARMDQLARLLLQITNGISPLLVLVPGLRRSFGGVGPYARFLARRARLWAALDALIAERRASGPREDILSLLLQARDEAGQPLADEDIRDQLILLVFAGHETTAIAIAWACYALHRPGNEDVLSRLHSAMANLAPPRARDPEHVAEVPYLEAVCQETLRRYPLAPAPNPRRLLQPLQIAGHTLPAGTQVAAAIGVVHFSEALYPDPLRFLPERFLDRKYTPFEFIPFGGGARRCLGAALAMYEMKLVLGTLIWSFHLRLRSSREDRGAVRAANAGPAHGVHMVVVENIAG